MEVIKVGELKSKFSSILKDVQSGKKFVVGYGKKGEKVAVLVPFQEYIKIERMLGLLETRGKLRIATDWKMTEEDLITL